MTSFLKSIFGTITSANSKNRRQCPGYFDAMRVNDNLRSDVIKGIDMTFKEDLNKFLGFRSTTIDFMYTLTSEWDRPSGAEIGMSYSYSKDQAQDLADR